MAEQAERSSFSGLAHYNIKSLFSELPTPCYVLDEARLRQNGETLLGVQWRTGCKILLAQKAFSNFAMYPLLEGYLAGTEASGLFEARLGREEMPGGEVHVFCGAYKRSEFDEVLKYADHIVLNSLTELARYGKKAKTAGKSVGLRINPEYSTQEGHAVYDPCAPGSRLGVTREQWDKNMTPELLELIDGVHFHTLCEQDSDALEETLFAVEEKFADALKRSKWINFGGGHHITRPGYNIDRLERLIIRTRERYGAQIYLEPGEACALDAGYLVAEVLDITENGGVTNAILDASAACHMPDVLEMPYRPPLYGAGEAGEYEYTYRLGGATCLAGDVIGDYSFEAPLKTGDRLVFGDMAIYTTCKNNTFNGMPLPAIARLHESGDISMIVQFGYEDFKRRLS